MRAVNSVVVRERGSDLPNAGPTIIKLLAFAKILLRAWSGEIAIHPRPT